MRYDFSLTLSKNPQNDGFHHFFHQNPFSAIKSWVWHQNWCLTQSLRLYSTSSKFEFSSQLWGFPWFSSKSQSLMNSWRNPSMIKLLHQTSFLTLNPTFLFKVHYRYWRLHQLWTLNLPLQSQDFEISSKSMSESSNSGFHQKVLCNSKIMIFGQRRQFDALNVQIIKRVDFHSLNAQIIISSFSDVNVKIWVFKSKSGILPFPQKS